MKILVLNSGSSSIKFQLFDMQGPEVLASGLVEQIGESEGRARLKRLPGSASEQVFSEALVIDDHRAGLKVMIRLLRQSGALSDIATLDGIGHRVVHGGERFSAPVRVDERVVAAIERLIPLAPLHNPANLTGIREALAHAADVPQVAVFDTAFHQRMPESAYLYALPYDLYEEHHVRRYGFHGTSHQYVARAAAGHLGKPLASLNMITLHLGNGASAAAIRGGVSVDTSMGLTPLEGLVMGTRCGDMDPAIIFYLARETSLGIDELDALLNRRSGLRGICGDNDMRAIIQREGKGDHRAQLALDMFCRRLKKYIGAYLAVLGGADCIVFTGGIGEHAPLVRQKACEGLERLGIRLDAEKNRLGGEGTRMLFGGPAARAPRCRR
jgi:acetate kinase